MRPEAIARYRRDTPACQNILHFNNAGAALLPLSVQMAMREHLELEYRLGGYEAAAIHAERSEAFYPTVADLLNAQVHQIAFVTSATDGYNRALSAIPFQPDDLILTTANDYASNQIAFLQTRKRYGVRIAIAPETPEGGVDASAMTTMIQDLAPRVVAVTHMPSSSGLIQDVYAIGRACRAVDTIYIVDACQTAGQLPLDVAAMGCDFLSATFRKFLRGPRGTGFLYVSDRILEQGLAPLYLDLHSAEWTAPEQYRHRPDARRFELWERNHAQVHGAVAAVRYAQTIGLEDIAARTQLLAGELRESLNALKGVTVADTGRRLGAIVTCYLPEQDPQTLLSDLRHAGVHGSIAWGDYARYDFPRKKIPWALRLSPHYYNTTEEIQKLNKKIFKIICC